MNINKQFRSVIEWENPNERELFIKVTDNFEEIKNASKLIVQEGQGCILTYEGKVQEVISQAGMYDLKTDNTPFITKLKKFFALRERSEHILGIWFYRKADIVNMRWGTRVPIAYTDPIYSFPILLSAFGNYSVKITEPLAFFETIIAGKHLFTHSDLKQIFLSRILQPITDYLANAKFSFVEIDSRLNEIAENTQAKTQAIFTDLGFQVLDFRIEGTQFDKETLDRIGEVSDVQAEVKSAQIAGVDFAELQKLKALRDVAKNEGTAGATMGMLTGLELGKTTTQAPKEDVKTKLLKLKELLDLELITKEEFQTKKMELLGKL
ncbi:MAG: SPFH domain-containing protein [Flavobacteriaceae bacterium]|nr:SPFH domain-containing protein [Flavobacteriaceae bacterium]